MSGSGNVLNSRSSPGATAGDQLIEETNPLHVASHHKTLRICFGTLSVFLKGSLHGNVHDSSNSSSKVVTELGQEVVAIAVEVLGVAAVAGQHLGLQQEDLLGTP